MAGQGGMVKRGWAVGDYSSWPVCPWDCELGRQFGAVNALG
jgi:hypothetical protein